MMSDHKYKKKDSKSEKLKELNFDIDHEYQSLVGTKLFKSTDEVKFSAVMIES